jgi:hypothetical protein
MARSAMIEAEAQLSKELDLLTVLPEETGRQQYELGLQIAFGMALIATRRYVSQRLARHSPARASSVINWISHPRLPR